MIERSHVSTNHHSNFQCVTDQSHRNMEEMTRLPLSASNFVSNLRRNLGIPTENQVMESLADLRSADTRREGRLDLPTPQYWLSRISGSAQFVHASTTIRIFSISQVSYRSVTRCLPVATHRRPLVHRRTRPGSSIAFLWNFSPVVMILVSNARYFFTLSCIIWHQFP